MENTKNIDEYLAHILIGSNYKIIDNEGAIFDIQSIGYDEAGMYFRLFGKKINIKNCWADEIGSKYFILAHPMSRIKEKIKGLQGDEIVPYYVLRMDTTSEGVGDLVYADYGESPSVLIDPFDYIGTIELFDKWNFAHRLPEGSWKEIQIL